MALIKSVISKDNARFGSKFSGEQAFWIYRWRGVAAGSVGYAKRSRVACLADAASMTEFRDLIMVREDLLAANVSGKSQGSRERRWLCSTFRLRGSKTGRSRECAYPKLLFSSCGFCRAARHDDTPIGIWLHLHVARVPSCCCSMEHGKVRKCLANSKLRPYKCPLHLEVLSVSRMRYLVLSPIE